MLLSPGVLFCGGFTIAIFNGLTNYKTWSFELHWPTVFLIAGSCLTVAIVCEITHKIFSLLHFQKEYITTIPATKMKTQLRLIYVPWWAYLAVFVLQILTFLLVLRFIYIATDAAANHFSLAQMLGQYDYMAKFSKTDKSIRGLLGLLYVSASASGYVWGYILIQNYLSSRQITLWALVNLLLSMSLPFMVGGRAGTIQMILAFMILLFLLLRESPSQQKLRRYAVGIVIGIVIVGIILFRPLLNLLGRESGQQSLYQYLSIYIGAPVKNLDIYIAHNLGEEQKSSVFGETTFSSIAQSISRWTGQPVVKNFGVTQPFQSIHNNDLGNVYTSLYSLLWDFGFIGCVGFIALMALLMQLIYEWIMVSGCRFYRQPIDLAKILYAFLSYGLVFAFLSNRFYSTVVSSVFIRQFALWLVACAVVCLFNRNVPSTVIRSCKTHVNSV